MIIAIAKSCVPLYQVYFYYITSLRKSVYMYLEIGVALSDRIAFQESVDKNIPDSNNYYSQSPR